MGSYLKILILIAVAASGCEKNSNRNKTSVLSKESTKPKATEQVEQEVSEHGAWYGEGDSFPDERLCLVFCPSGKLFIGDKKCDKTDAGDFENYFEYKKQGNKISTSFKKVPEFEFHILTPQTAQFSFKTFKKLGVTKVQKTSSLCTSKTATLASPEHH